MDRPFFTVVIPTYNRAELLRDAIRSVLDQTFQEFELIVVDDHSTDDTKEVMGSFKDNRIRYILNDRGRGGAGTRNAGIFRAKGEWVAFLDDDDIWMSNKLELQHKRILEVDGTFGLVYTGFAKYDLETKRETSLFMPWKEGWIQNDLFSDNYIGTMSTVAIRTGLLKAAGGLDERFPASQDYDLYVRIAGVSRVAFVNEKLVLFMQHHRDRITGDGRKKLIARSLFWEKHKDIIREPRLRHRVAARYFASAVVHGDLKGISKSLPWTLSGLFFDIPNLFNTFRAIFKIYARKLLGNRLLPKEKLRFQERE